MFAVSGILSDRLRKIFGPDVTQWPAHRQAEAIRDMPAHQYSGQTLGRRYRHQGEHRR